MPEQQARSNSFSSRRRRLLQALPLLALPSGLLAQSRDSTIPVTGLANFVIRVRDPERSQAFYQRLFGMPVLSRVDGQVNLRVGEGLQFMGIRPLLPGEAPAITHIGYTVASDDMRELRSRLQARGYGRIEPPSPAAPGIANAHKTWLRREGGVETLYFADPRGLIVQLTPPGFCGGAENGGCTAAQSTAPGLMRLEDINHFTVFLNDGAGANQDYQDLFGLEVQAYQGPDSPVNGVGDGHQFVMYAGPARAEASPANIHHACFTMHDFDVEEVLGILSREGLQAQGESALGPMMHYVSRRMPERGGAEGGTPELYFTDPDGMLMQLQDLTYCGGGGKMGEICL